MEMFIFSVFTPLVVTSVIAVDQRLCWYTSHAVGTLSVHHVETSSDDTNGQINGSSQTCPEKTNYCYALWKEVTNNSSTSGIFIIDQGCWESSGKQDCENVSCVTTRKPPKALNDTNFCCCKGDFCNGNVTQLHYLENVEVLPFPSDDNSGKSLTTIVVISLVLFVMLVLCLPAFVFFTCILNKSQTQKFQSYTDTVHLIESGPVHNSKFTHENLKLEEIIGQGRYGSVWKGTVEDQVVAVKIFQSHHRNYFYNELDIYCAPFMMHPTLLSYYGCDERIGVDGNTEYLLFLSFAPNGTVQEFLNVNVVDWNTFCNMALSIAKGVAYLHSDIKKGDKSKPCISHRDLNTKNILVKEDLTCVICDLGFATKISGSRYYYNGEEQRAEVKSINDVGTLRYMSPEVLEGAVNLRDCETALKQIDVYALGLILWELATRCSDFYPAGIECPAYRLPFEAEIGHPTFEQMQILVCKHKARPLFPDLWRDSLGVRSVKETIEDCWDQDAEARLTALCVEERFHELSAMSERQKVNFYSSSGISPAARSSLIQRDSQNALSLLSCNKEDNSVSESTTDTSLTMTPANPKNSNQFQGIYVSSSVQPYQGRNLCLERNLMVPSQWESHSIDHLIDKSSKNITTNRLGDEYLNIDPIDLDTSDHLPTGVRGGYTNHSEPSLRSNAPIPFVKNVKVDQPAWTSKQSNLVRPSNQKKKMNWKTVKRIFERRLKADTEPYESNINTSLLPGDKYVNINLSSPVATLEPKLETEVLLYNGKLETKINAPLRNLSDGKEDISKNPSNFFLTSECQSKRPTTLPLFQIADFSSSNFELRKNNVDNKCMTPSNEAKKNFNECKSLSELGSNLTSTTLKGATSSPGFRTELAESKKILKRQSTQKADRANEQSCGDILDGKDGFIKEEKSKGFSERLNINVQDEKLNCSPLRSSSLRIRTNGNISEEFHNLKVTGRLSLCDDRIMSGLDYSQQKIGNQNLYNSCDSIVFSQRE